MNTKKIKNNTRKKIKGSDVYDSSSDAIFLCGDSYLSLDSIPNNSVKLIISSPPYNLGKEYEDKKSLKEYFASIIPIIKKIKKLLANDGSICWQVGNHVNKGEIYPLDIFYYQIFKDLGFKLRNRIIWHFNHGLHGTKRLSGRYETMLWFTKSDDYTFNLDAVRIPQKYPGKRQSRAGKSFGKPTANKLGKNPSDYWEILLKEEELGFWDIPNVKANHVEKTLHPCSFPIELVERCVLAYSNEGDFVLDPFCGVGSTMVGALMNNRKAIGCELFEEYMKVAKDRVKQLEKGELPYRPLGKAIHVPKGNEKVARIPEEWKKKNK